MSVILGKVKPDRYVWAVINGMATYVRCLLQEQNIRAINVLVRDVPDRFSKLFSFKVLIKENERLHLTMRAFIICANCDRR